MCSTFDLLPRPESRLAVCAVRQIESFLFRPTLEQIDCRDRLQAIAADHKHS
jgi:hypothetical protein